MKDETHFYNIIAFVVTVCAIVALALFGNGRADLAIQTGLVGVLGSFAPWGRAAVKAASAPADAQDAAAQVAGAAEAEASAIKGGA